MTLSRTLTGAALLAALFLLSDGLSPAYAEDMPTNQSTSPASPDSIEPQTGQVVTETLPPETPVVAYLDGRLSVHANEVLFGDLMVFIANEAGFDVSISPDIAEKVVSTSFDGIELQKAIQRLLSLISHRNYSIDYDKTDDTIVKLEVYSVQQVNTGKTPPPKGISGPGAPTKPLTGTKRTGVTTPEGRTLTGNKGRRPAIDTTPTVVSPGTRVGPGAPPVPRIGGISAPSGRPKPEDFIETEPPVISPSTTPKYIPPAQKNQ